MYTARLEKKFYPESGVETKKSEPMNW